MRKMSGVSSEFHKRDARPTSPRHIGYEMKSFPLYAEDELDRLSEGHISTISVACGRSARWHDRLPRQLREPVHAIRTHDKQC